ncbi:Hsp20/alpha crystallin family protein, partial [Candidatus Woesearchaeota archaeon]|nr:Hsp20/alpha crystallin family protein [Candidatus Woesearchaeota archaeon]
MKLVPWRKRDDVDFFFTPLVDFRRETDDIFDRFFGKSLITRDEEGFTPKIEVAEDDKSYSVKAELPGLEKDDISVSIDDSILTLKGEKKEEKEEKNKSTYYRETHYGSFLRQIPFHAEIDEGKVNAKFNKGILTLTVPKKEVKEKKSIKINVE